MDCCQIHTLPVSESERENIKMGTKCGGSTLWSAPWFHLMCVWQKYQNKRRFSSTPTKRVRVASLAWHQQHGIQLYSLVNWVRAARLNKNNLDVGVVWRWWSAASNDVDGRAPARSDETKIRNLTVSYTQGARSLSFTILMMLPHPLCILRHNPYL